MSLFSAPFLALYHGLVIPTIMGPAGHSIPIISSVLLGPAGPAKTL